jgi:hypothetical protein
MRYDFVDLATLAKKLGSDAQTRDSDANHVFLQQLAEKQPKSQYGNAEHTHYYQLWQLRRVLFWTSIGLVVASLLWSMQETQMQDVHEQQEIDTAIQRAQNIKLDRDRVLAAMPKSDASPSDIKTAVTTLRTLLQRSSTPQEFIIPLSKVMNNFTKVQLDEFSWKTSATEPVAANTAADIPAQVLTLKAHLEDSIGNTRNALEYLDQFKAALEKQDYLVSIIDRPLDVSSQGSLSNATDSQDKSRNITLKLVWRPAS